MFFEARIRASLVPCGLPKKAEGVGLSSPAKLRVSSLTASMACTYSEQHVSRHLPIVEVLSSSFGNLSDGCDSSGTHFNPDDATHGAPNALVRHVGDLGNIEADDEGVAKLSLTDYEISLRGYKSIIGYVMAKIYTRNHISHYHCRRTLIIHGGEDDLGLGGTPMSPINGNSGAKVACGIIGEISRHRTSLCN